jgi:hypothetical protein
VDPLLIVLLVVLVVLVAGGGYGWRSGSAISGNIVSIFWAVLLVVILVLVLRALGVL